MYFNFTTKMKKEKGKGKGKEKEKKYRGFYNSQHPHQPSNADV